MPTTSAAAKSKPSSKSKEFLGDSIPHLVYTLISVCIVAWAVQFIGRERFSLLQVTIIYALGLSLLEYLLFLLHERIAIWFRSKSTSAHGSPSRGMRFVTTAVWFVAVPIFVGIFSNTITPPILAFLSAILHPGANLASSARIANIVLSSPDLNTKTAGIQALGGIGTDDSVGELERILESEKRCFTESNCYGAMKQALIASHKASVGPMILKVLDGHLDEARGQVGIQITSLSDRYFRADVEALRRTLRSQAHGDDSATAIKAKIDALEAQIETSIVAIQKELPEGSDQSALVELLLDAYSQLEPSKADREMSAFAKRIATDDAFSEGVRSRALMVVGSAGDLDDGDWLLKVAEGKSEDLKAPALDAFATLYAKRAKHKEGQASSP